MAEACDPGDNVAEEEEYIAKEDSGVIAEITGEEPDLKYEKWFKVN